MYVYIYIYIYIYICELVKTILYIYISVYQADDLSSFTSPSFSLIDVAREQELTHGAQFVGLRFPRRRV